MPLRLNIVNDKVIITPSMKVIPDLDKVITMSNKNKSNQYLMYIYFSASLEEDNPYRDLEESVRQRESLYRAFGTTKKTELTEEEAKLIVPAREAFIKHTETADERIVFSYNKKLDELKILLDENVPIIERWENASTGQITFVTNSDILTKIMTGIDTIIEKREKIKASLLHQYTLGRVKGNYQSSLIEKGNFKDISKEQL